MDSVPTVKHKEKIMQLSANLDIPGIDLFAVFIYLHNGKFTWVSNFPEAADEYAQTGLYRADILQEKSFRKLNRVIYTEEYAELDPVQSKITKFMADRNFYRIYCLSRFCSDCSLLLCTNRFDEKESNPAEFYNKTVDAFENFSCYFINNAMDIFLEYLPELKKTRFGSDANFRNNVIKNRADPPTEKLSQGEIDVLYWAAQGKTAEETAILLGLTKHTLETYRKRATNKLNAANITHAVYLAQQNQIIV